VEEAAVQAIQAAIAALGPARLFWGQIDWPAGPAEPRSTGPIDTTLTALRIVRPSGAPVATVIDYAMHPTIEPRKPARLSGDWPGALSAALEVSGNVALVLQGASGNATWSRGAGTLESVAARIGEAAGGVLDRAQGASVANHNPGESARLSCEVRLVSLPPAQAGPGVPLLLRRAAGNLLALFAEPTALRTTLSIDGLTLLGVPGEPVGALAQAARAGAPGKLTVVGLADGYVGYIEPPGGTGEAARTYHGPGLAESLGLWKAR
jgi:neutral ceramidase